MNVKLRAHYKAAVDFLELMSIASLLALVGDAIWIVRDITVNGFTLGLGIVGVMLWTALIAMMYAFYKYHHKAVAVILHEMLEKKSMLAKKRSKARARGVL